MQPHPRYEVIGAIASGDFATVYRGRDKELGREVAIKQIHPHFLNDPRRLESFWKEAQLLASLAHPHVMSIYDLVRDRGWLILEFMQGNLQQYAGGQPLDVEVLRTALTSSLEALAFLHKSGVTHGDVKPTNLLIDRLGRIRLGDFGLARRASSEQGSLLKGTTKYMAPEMLGAAFGKVGPPSDLYSLGFSIYELAVGQENFDALFPGLEAFGSDKQIAWMMWHGAADRHAPPIDRVLPNLPADLAAVINKLIAKPQSQRFRNADAALRELNAAPATLPPEQDDEEEIKRQGAVKRKRIMSFAAAGVSLALCLLMLLWPGGKTKTPPPAAPQAIRGIVRQVTPSRQMLVLEVDDAGLKKEVEVLLGDHHRVFLNDKASILRDLKEQDHVIVHAMKDAEGRELKVVDAARAQSDQGTIAEIKADEGTIAVSTGAANSTPMVLSVPPTAAITINDRPAPANAPYSLASLKVGDAIAVEHEPDETGRLARSIKITRQVTARGTLAAVDAAKRQIRFTPETAGGSTSPLVSLAVGDGCEITLNGLRFVQNAPVTLKDFRAGDKLTILHDITVTRIDAIRVFTERGTIRGIAYDVKSIEIAIAGTNASKTFVLAPEGKVVVAEYTVMFDDLRRGDTVEVSHASPEGNTIQASEIKAVRTPDPGKWALLIYQQNYDDANLTGSPPPGVAQFPQPLDQHLVNWYGVPVDQVIKLRDESRQGLSNAIPKAITKAGKAKQLIVCYVGRAFPDSDGKVYLAPKEFGLDRISASGVSLKWFIEQIEASPANEKLLLFDAAFALRSGNPPQLSSAEMIATIQGTKSNPGLKTTTVIATSQSSPAPLRIGNHASVIDSGATMAFRGAADKNRDLHIDHAELMAHFNQNMPTTVLFLPNNTPPRLTDEAKEAIRALATIAGKRRVEIDKEDAASAFQTAARLAPKQPEADVLYMFVFLKQRQLDEVHRLADLLKGSHPDLLVVHAASAWSRFVGRDTAKGMAELTELVTRLKITTVIDPDKPPQSLRLLRFAGQLREYAEKAAPPERVAKPDAVALLDNTVQRLGPRAVAAYTAGRTESQRIMKEFDAKIAAAEFDPDMQLLLRRQRQELQRYLDFPYDDAIADLLRGMEE